MVRELYSENSAIWLDGGAGKIFLSFDNIQFCNQGQVNLESKVPSFEGQLYHLEQQYCWTFCQWILTKDIMERPTLLQNEQGKVKQIDFAHWGNWLSQLI